MSQPYAIQKKAEWEPDGMQRYFRLRDHEDRLDVVSVLYQGLTQGGNRTILTFEGKVHDASSLARRTAGMQRWLESKGVAKGDRVAVMLTNSLDHIALIYALMLSGVIWVPVNVRLRGAALAHILEHSRPSLIVCEAPYCDAITALDAPLAPLVALPDDQGEAWPEMPLQTQEVRHQDTLCILYTSGTTGPPKGVLFTHRMMRIATESAIAVADVRAGARMFMWEPLCHIGGAQLLLIPFLAPVELYVLERFSSSRFWEQWKQSRATHLHYLGGILDILVRSPLAAKPDGLSVEVAWGAGLALGAWEVAAKKLGCRIRECYGMTECSSFATYNASGKPGSIGKPLPWISVELLDDNGQPVSTGQIGEMVLSSDLQGALFPGYFDNPQATARALRGGKLYTGDLARQDAQGDYAFVGRSTDSMRVRGENVSAWEVERVFQECEAVRACAAVGVAAEVGEQEILLYVLFEDGRSMPWEQLVAWAGPRMAAFQLPRYYRSVAAFELTPSERIRKHTLDKNPGGAWDRQSAK